MLRFGFDNTRLETPSPPLLITVSTSRGTCAPGPQPQLSARVVDLSWLRAVGVRAVLAVGIERRESNEHGRESSDGSGEVKRQQRCDEGGPHDRHCLPWHLEPAHHLLGPPGGKALKHPTTCDA